MGPLADILLLGLGGLGCPVVIGLSQRHPYLRWILCDGDTVDRSNLPRQWLYSEADVGQRKTTIAARGLRHVETRGAVSKAELPALITSARVVVECSDDVELKFAVSDAVVAAGGRAVIGGITGVDGFVLAYAERACLRCVFESPTDDMRRTCADAGVLAPGPSIVGSCMAEAIDRSLHGGSGDGFWSFALKEGRSRSVPFSRRATCGAAHAH